MALFGAYIESSCEQKLEIDSAKCPWYGIGTDNGARVNSGRCVMAGNGNASSKRSHSVVVPLSRL
jgi:hypothetical protein